MKTKQENGESQEVTRNSIGRHFKLGFLLVGTALMNPAFSATVFASEADNGSAITVLVFNFRQAPAQTLAKAYMIREFLAHPAELLTFRHPARLVASDPDILHAIAEQRPELFFITPDGRFVKHFLKQ